MSGGSYNYAYRHIEELADEIRAPGKCGAEYGKSSAALRAAFAAHLRKVASAAQAIEWNDSGDGDDHEADLIRACLPADAEINEAIKAAELARDALNAAIERAK